MMYENEHPIAGDGTDYQQVHSNSSHPSQHYTGSISSQRRRSLPSGPALAENMTASVNAGLASESPQSEDFIHEVLAINTLAMQRTKVESLAEAMDMLNEAYQKLNHPEADTIVDDTQMLDQLRATTLNNMGVTECRRGQPRQALSHFEGCRQLEEKWNIASPSVALNTCAAYNTLRMYDKATAAALETIDMLRTLELQKKRAKKLEQERQSKGEQSPLQRGGPPFQHGEISTTSRSSAKRNIALANPSSPAAGSTKSRKAAREEEDMLEAAAHPSIAHSDNAALWAAAWHNLGVAQVNSAKSSKDASEYSNALSIFENALRTTQDKLGDDHPMTKDLTETFRLVRKNLRKNGAFNRHRTMKNAPMPLVDPRLQQLEEMKIEPKDGESKHRAIENSKKDLTITFRGEVTGGQKLVERIDPTPYPRALDQAFQQKRGKGKGGAGNRGLPFNRTLAAATKIYGNPHPLLRSGVGAQDPEWANGNLPNQPHQIDNGGMPPKAPRGSQRSRSGPHSGSSSARGGPHRPPPPSTGGGGYRGPESDAGGGSGGRRYPLASQGQGYAPPHGSGGGGDSNADDRSFHSSPTQRHPNPSSGGRQQRRGNSDLYGSEIPESKRTVPGNSYSPNPRHATGGRLPPLSSPPQRSLHGAEGDSGFGETYPPRQSGHQLPPPPQPHRGGSGRSPGRGGPDPGRGMGGRHALGAAEGVPHDPYSGSPNNSVQGSFHDGEFEQPYSLGSGQPQQQQTPPRQQQQQQQQPQLISGLSDSQQKAGYLQQQQQRSPAGPIGYDIGAGPALPPESYEQSKFLLLAQPPVTATMSTHYYQLALDPPPGIPRAGGPQKPVQLIGAYDALGQPSLADQQQQQQQQPSAGVPPPAVSDGATPSSRMESALSRPYDRFSVPTEEVGIQQTIPIADATTQISSLIDAEPEGPHELFGAMWVVADNRFIRKGKRSMDRPKYYVNAVLNVEEDGRASAFLPEPIPEPKTAMMVYSGDSSADNSRLNTPVQPRLSPGSGDGSRG